MNESQSDAMSYSGILIAIKSYTRLTKNLSPTYFREEGQEFHLEEKAFVQPEDQCVSQMACCICATVSFTFSCSIAYEAEMALMSKAITL